jgi:hypothetical protein
MPPLPLSPAPHQLTYELSFLLRVEFWRQKQHNILEVKTMANCETCKGKEAHAPESVPYIVHESSMARMERQIKRLWIALVVCIAMLFACNAGWLIYESQFATISYEQDGEGINNVNIGEQGDLINGTESEDPG